MSSSSKHPSFRNAKTLTKKSYPFLMVRLPTKTILLFLPSKPNKLAWERNNFLLRVRKLESLTMKNLPTQSKPISKIKLTNFLSTTLKLKRNLLCNLLSRHQTSRRLSPCLIFPQTMKNQARHKLIRNKKLSHKPSTTLQSKSFKNYFQRTQSQKTIFYYSK